MESSPRQGLAPDSSSSDESTVKAEPQAPAETHQIDTEENPETRDNMSSSPAPTADRTIQLREKALQDAHKASSAFTGVTEEDMETLVGLHYLSYGYGKRITEARGPISKNQIERHFVRFDQHTRKREDYKDLSSVYCGEDGFEEAQAQLEEAMKSQCYERIKLVKGIRKRVLVRIYFDDKRNIFTQAKGDDATFNKKYSWAFH